MDRNPQWIVLAHILRPQGRKGEVLADLLTDFPERFADASPRLSRTPRLRRSIRDSRVDSSSPACSPPRSPPTGCPSAETPAASCSTLPASTPSSRPRSSPARRSSSRSRERVALDPGAAYISDLIGCTVYDRGQPLGIVDDVQFPTTPDGARRLEEAAPLLAVVSPEGDEILIPFANAFLVELDLAARPSAWPSPKAWLRSTPDQPPQRRKVVPSRNRAALPASPCASTSSPSSPTSSPGRSTTASSAAPSPPAPSRSRTHDLRAFTHDRHRTVDDRPFGGGEGMVLKPEPIFDCVESLGSSGGHRSQTRPRPHPPVRHPALRAGQALHPVHRPPPGHARARRPHLRPLRGRRRARQRLLADASSPSATTSSPAANSPPPSSSTPPCACSPASSATPTPPATRASAHRRSQPTPQTR